jgi:mono/diheme cytochrome c family protein
VNFPAPFALAGLLLLAGCEAARPLPEAPPGPRVFDAALVKRGEQLAAVGNCRACHTKHGGIAYSGGFAMHSPFGTLYSTNITPDRETGLGRYSEEAFRRAMREGLRHDGEHLYPAFPYDRYTRTTDEDIAAIYAYLMSLTPVRYTPPGNELVFPFNVRAGIAVWKRMHFKPPVVRPVGDRGEYLVEGLGHCGSCHSPRTRLFAEDLARAYDGGEAEGWHAYALNEKSGAAIPWDAKSMAAYLRHGYHPEHGISRGTMGVVTHELAAAAPGDIEAMAAYVVRLMKTPSAERAARARELLRDPKVSPGGSSPGAVLYETTCRGCHSGRGELPWDGLALPLSIGLTGESPRNLVNVILHGLPAAAGGETAPMMPGYAGALDDAQVETLVAWMRANLTNQPPWPEIGKHVAASRKMTQDMLLFPPGGTGKEP